MRKKSKIFRYGCEKIGRISANSNQPSSESRESIGRESSVGGPEKSAKLYVANIYCCRPIGISIYKRHN
jgi:hypothetical protein